MRVAYYRDTDSLYVVLRGDRRYVESEEIAPASYSTSTKTAT